MMSFIERSYETLRLNDAHLQRKTHKFCKNMGLLKSKTGDNNFVLQFY